MVPPADHISSFLLFLPPFLVLRVFPADHAERSRLPQRMVRSSSSTATRNQSTPTCPPSASLQPISSSSQQLLQQQVQPLPQRSHAHTPSPVGEGPLVRLPPPPHRSSHRHGSGERVAAANGGTTGVEHRVDSCSGGDEQPVELLRSFSSFSVSPSAAESLDFLRGSFYCDQGSALGGASTRCATVRPYIAQAESDSESELHPPSPDHS